MARNVAELRDHRRMTVRGLSAVLDELGRKILPSGITKVESQSRSVDAGDLVALAVALGVNPSRLLLPPTAGESPVHLTPRREVSAREAWLWADGCEPLPAPDAVPVTAADVRRRRQHPSFVPVEDFQRREEFTRLARPVELREHEHQPVVRLAQALMAGVRRFRALRGQDARAAERQAEDLRQYVSRLADEVEALINGDDRPVGWPQER